MVFTITGVDSCFDYLVAKFPKMGKIVSLLCMVLMVINIPISRASISGDTSFHKGWLMGMAFGGGTIHLSTGSDSKREPVLSIPNFKIGYWVNTKTSVHFLMPGAVYNLKASDRIFEAFQIGASRWITPRWWVLAATGLTFDAGAFYTVDKFSQIKANTGLPSLSLGTGWELWSHKRYGLDIQYRYFYGRSNLEQDQHRVGQAHVILIGLTLY